MSNLGKLLISLLATSLFGCATTYNGALPDFSLKGEPAKTEFINFKVDDSFWGSGRNWKMGPGQTTYTLSSVRPLVKAVSKDADRGITISNYLYIGGLISLVVYFDKQSKNGFDQGTLNSLLLVGGLSSAGIYFLYDSKRSYNEELKSKFTPMISWNRSF
jgi:hypothetical protein